MIEANTTSKYVRVETAISIAINAAISAGFAVMMFGGEEQTRVWGENAVALDFLPQTFMISLMSVVVPTLLTRRRLKSGVLREAGRRSRLPANTFARAALIAVLATLLLGSMAIGILAATGLESVAFRWLLPAKVIYGSFVALLVTPIAIRAALGDVIRAL